MHGQNHIKFIHVFTTAHHFFFFSQSKNPLYAATSYSLNIHFNIIPPTSTSSKWSLSFTFPHQDSVCFSLLGHACHIPFPSQPPWWYHLTMRSTNHEAHTYVIFSVSPRFHLDLSPVLNQPQSTSIPLTFYSLPVTWCTTSLTFNNCTLCPHCIYVFCVYLRTNSDLCHLQHKLIGFYNRGEKCLQRGTDWVFK